MQCFLKYHGTVTTTNHKPLQEKHHSFYKVEMQQYIDRNEIKLEIINSNETKK